MAKKDKDGNWIDRRGRKVPPRFVDPIDKNRDVTVERVVLNALKLQKRMEAEKKRFVRWIREHVEYMEKKAEAVEETKGNLTLTNYIGNQQVEIKINEVIAFDERLQVAKGIIDSCLRRWTEGAHVNLKAIVDQAFSVDKKGKVDEKAIARLQKIQIKDPEWKKAMDLINQSRHVDYSRTYLNIRIRKNGEEKWQTVNLNFSSL